MTAPTLFDALRVQEARLGTTDRYRLCQMERDRVLHHSVSGTTGRQPRQQAHRNTVDVTTLPRRHEGHAATVRGGSMTDQILPFEAEERRVRCEVLGCDTGTLEPGCDAHDTYDGHDEHFWCENHCPECAP